MNQADFDHTSFVVDGFVLAHQDHGYALSEFTKDAVFRVDVVPCARICECGLFGSRKGRLVTRRTHKREGTGRTLPTTCDMERGGVKRCDGRVWVSVGGCGQNWAGGPGGRKEKPSAHLGFIEGAHMKLIGDSASPGSAHKPSTLAPI